MNEEKHSIIYNKTDFKDFSPTNPALSETLGRKLQSKKITHTQEDIKNKKIPEQQIKRRKRNPYQ